MTRLTLTLVAWMSLVATGTASVAPQKAFLVTSGDLPPLRLAKLPAPATEPAIGLRSNAEFVMTERTEVVLNGKACKYADVPAKARIVRMEVAADRKTVLKIHFRTGK